MIAVVVVVAVTVVMVVVVMVQVVIGGVVAQVYWIRCRGDNTRGFWCRSDDEKIEEGSERKRVAGRRGGKGVDYHSSGWKYPSDTRAV